MPGVIIHPHDCAGGQRPLPADRPSFGRQNASRQQRQEYGYRNESGLRTASNQKKCAKSEAERAGRRQRWTQTETPQDQDRNEVPGGEVQYDEDLDGEVRIGEHPLSNPVAEVCRRIGQHVGSNGCRRGA